jgi:hypothetical protein
MSLREALLSLLDIPEGGNCVSVLFISALVSIDFVHLYSTTERIKRAPHKTLRTLYTAFSGHCLGALEVQSKHRCSDSWILKGCFCNCILRSPIMSRFAVRAA